MAIAFTFSGAKQSATRKSRIEKFIPHILEGKGVSRSLINRQLRMKITNTRLTFTISNLDTIHCVLRLDWFYTRTAMGKSLRTNAGTRYRNWFTPSVNVIATGASNMSIGLTVDDFEAASSNLKELGIAYSERSEEGGDFIHFADPDGNPLYIIKPKW